MFVVIISCSDLQKLSDHLDWIFRFIPQYCLGQSLADIYSNHRMVEVCTANDVVESICVERS